MTGDAFTSGFIIITAVLVAIAIEACAVARRRARRRAARGRPDIEPVSWRAMDRINHRR